MCKNGRERFCVRLFAAAIADGRTGHDTALALLRRAVREVWGCACPEIGKTAAGKPFFVGRPGMFCSISHTRTHVLVGLSSHPLGVDIETPRRLREGLRDRLFTPEEQRDFSFLEGWTLREAVYKLTGQGSLRTMRLAREGGEIVTPFPGVRCRVYADVPGCVASAACRRGQFPAHIEIVPADAFLP